MLEETYSLIELAKLSRIEPRTIRSYIAKGLLAGAATRGPNSAYSGEHLDRLKVIQRVRKVRPTMTLDEIRLQLQQLTPQQIRQIAKGQLPVDVVLGLPELKPATDSALAYLERLRSPAPSCEPQAQLFDEPQSCTSAAPAVPKNDRTAIEQLVDALESLVGPKMVSATSKSSQWFHIEVTPDIELCVRGKFSGDQIDEFHRVADLLRYLITRGVPGD